jgi:hypothetical protein
MVGFLNRSLLSKTDFDSAYAYYVPNKLPNIFEPMSNYGISDYEGSMDLFSSLDASLSYYDTDLKKSTFQTFFPENSLLRNEKGEMIQGNFHFDKSGAGTNLYSGIKTYDLNGETNEIIHKAPIIDSVKYEKHLQIIRENIYRNMGLAPATLGIPASGIDGQALASKREEYSLRTRSEKMSE